MAKDRAPAHCDDEPGAPFTVDDDASSQKGTLWARGERRKCKACLRLFRPDPRSHGRHIYQTACLVAVGEVAAAGRERNLIDPAGMSLKLLDAATGTVMRTCGSSAVQQLPGGVCEII